MYVGIVQPTQKTIPAAKRVVIGATKTATKKLQQLSFDVKPNKLVSDTKQNAYKIFCGGGGGDLYYSLSCGGATPPDLYSC